jgi:hypothetical protein
MEEGNPNEDIDCVKLFGAQMRSIGDLPPISTGTVPRLTLANVRRAVDTPGISAEAC